MQILEVKELECTRDDRRLFSGLHFSLGAADVLQIEGPNGSGKTSLLRILCGLRQADAGEVFWQGEPLNNVREDYYANMVYIGHLPCIKGDLTVAENIRALLDTRSQSASIEVIYDALKQVGLNGFDDVPGKALSSGQRRRILLAFILLSKANLWILDEPLTALDIQGVELMESMILKHREEGGSVIFTTHHGMELDGNLRSIKLGYSADSIESLEGAC